MRYEESGLTVREQEVCGLVARGLPNKMIAYHLGICEPTVKSHIIYIMKKLGVTNRVQIALTFHGIDFREEIAEHPANRLANRINISRTV